MYSRNTHLDKLHESHPVFTEIGENMWVGPVEDFTVTTAIRSWHEERKSYSYLNDTCVEDQNCSHYIQVTDLYIVIKSVGFSTASPTFLFQIYKLEWENDSLHMIKILILSVSLKAHHSIHYVNHIRNSHCLHTSRPRRLFRN